MLKVTAPELIRMEMDYPGIAEQIRLFDKGDVPACAKCASENTANVQ